MKHEWRKQEKSVYLPKAKPEYIEVPEYQFLTVAGACNPDHPDFAERVAVLYAMSYAIKMNLKKNPVLEGYQDYTVYPLEGIWDITDEARERFTGTINKDDLVFRVMIRQPDLVTREYAQEMIAWTMKKKPNRYLEDVCFTTITDGPCIQMLHKGPYEDEPASFAVMEAFAEGEGWKRISKEHREIYLTDFRKVAPEKLKTVLRFQVER